jgi:hypothetical protein
VNTLYAEAPVEKDSSPPASNPAQGFTNATADSCSHRLSSPRRSSSLIDLPLYLQDLPASIQSEDLDYLAAKGAFALPARDFLNICLCRYIEFVHPVLPLLNLNATIMSLDDATGMSGKTSILLLFAIIYAALPFVESKHVRAASYSSKLEARTAIYKKAKVNTTN